MLDDRFGRSVASPNLSVCSDLHSAQHALKVPSCDLIPFSEEDEPINPVGACSVRVQGPYGKRALRFPGPAEFTGCVFVDLGVVMSDVVIPARYRVLVRVPHTVFVRCTGICPLATNAFSDQCFNRGDHPERDGRELRVARRSDAGTNSCESRRRVAAAE